MMTMHVYTVLYHLMEHPNTNSILIDQQFGFRSGHYCESQLNSEVEDIHLAIDLSHQVDVIAIYRFSKSF